MKTSSQLAKPKYKGAGSIITQIRVRNRHGMAEEDPNVQLKQQLNLALANAEKWKQRFEASQREAVSLPEFSMRLEQQSEISGIRPVDSNGVAVSGGFPHRIVKCRKTKEELNVVLSERVIVLTFRIVERETGNDVDEHGVWNKPLCFKLDLVRADSLKELHPCDVPEKPGFWQSARGTQYGLYSTQMMVNGKLQYSLKFLVTSKRFDDEDQEQQMRFRLRCTTCDSKSCLVVPDFYTEPFDVMCREYPRTKRGREEIEDRLAEQAVSGVSRDQSRSAQNPQA